MVYEEVKQLADKLREQAKHGRETTLDISERINEYKARTSDLSRKMLENFLKNSEIVNNACKSLPKDLKKILKFTH